VRRDDETDVEGIGKKYVKRVKRRLRHGSD
jgi:hypothetical protein